jgi:putative pyruvate formate lyase activating enzyme
MDPVAHRQIDSRVEIARKALRECRLCPRNCGVDRTAGRKGYCRLDDGLRVYREVLYWGEEKELNPSHQVYFAGCNLKCDFCAVGEWNESPEEAPKADIEQLVTVIGRRRKEGAKNLNLLGGEPAVNVCGIIELLGRLDDTTAVVWNSNMYYNAIVDELMAGLMDICLADFKCGNADCARRLLDSADYVEVVKENIVRAARHCDVIVRCLVLPGHSDCCAVPILEWLAEEAPTVKVSLRGNYVPPARPKEAPPGYLPPAEFERVERLAQKMKLKLIQ